MLTPVHELEYAFSWLASAALSVLLAQTRQFIACSNAVAENLLHRHGVAPERVETVHEYLPVDQVRAEKTRQQVLEELRLPVSAALVVGGGTSNWNKGGDLFVQLARVVCRQRSNVYFVWIGGSYQDVTQLEHDVQLAGLAEKVRLTGVVSKPADYFAAADVFAFSSRVDSYPLPRHSGSQLFVRSSSGMISAARVRA
jgi:hypothetical protein